MSLDVYLTEKRPEKTRCDRAAEILREHGFEDFAVNLESRYVHGDVEVYSANITHNLNRMAEEAGIYKHLWRPDEIGITKASQLIDPLRSGLASMIADPKRFEAHNPANGWGSYDGFVPWIQQYLSACEDHPNADVRVSR